MLPLKSDGDNVTAAEYNELRRTNLNDSTIGGLAGDGITDDTANIQAAMDALTTGGIVTLPRGVFRITANLTVPNAVTLRGQGRLSNQIAPAGPCELLKDGNFVGVRLVGIGARLENLTVRGAAGNGGNGVAMEYPNQSIRDVDVLSMGQDGIRVGGPLVTNTWYIERVYCGSNGRDGIFIDSETGAVDANAGTLIAPNCQLNGRDGIRMGRGFLNSVHGFLTEGNAGVGIHCVAGGNNNFFAGGDSEGNTGGDVLFDATTSGNVLLSQLLAFIDNGTNVILSTGVNGLVLSGALGVGGAVKSSDTIQVSLPNNKYIAWYNAAGLAQDVGLRVAADDKLHFVNANGDILTFDALGNVVIVANGAGNSFKVGSTFLGFYGVAPVARAGAIGSPAADVAALKVAVDAIRAALTNVGLTS